MREIKFRAWHNPLQRMFYSDSQEDAEFWGAKVGDSVFETFVHSFVNLFLDNNRQLMQYTGLKDKNDKEIYEGDILRWGDRMKIVKQTPGGWNPFIDDMQTDGAWHYEILGNIYENKDVKPFEKEGGGIE